MHRILEIVKSIKFWTILGVLASLVGLFYAFFDESDKNALALSVGEYVVSEPKGDKEIVLVNIVNGWRSGAPILIPIPFSIANRSNKTVENVAMNYLGNLSEWENCRVVNKSVTPHISLASLYISAAESFAPFRLGEGISITAITPKTSIGSNGEGAIYMPLIYPAFKGDFMLQSLPKLEIVLRGDNCAEKRMKVQMLMAFVNNYKDASADAYKNMCNAVIRNHTENASSLIFVPYTIGSEQKLYKIEQIPFFRLSVELENIINMDKK